MRRRLTFCFVAGVLFFAGCSIPYPADWKLPAGIVLLFWALDVLYEMKRDQEVRNEKEDNKEHEHDSSEQLRTTD